MLLNSLWIVVLTSPSATLSSSLYYTQLWVILVQWRFYYRYGSLIERPAAFRGVILVLWKGLLTHTRSSESHDQLTAFIFWQFRSTSLSFVNANYIVRHTPCLLFCTDEIVWIPGTPLIFLLCKVTLSLKLNWGLHLKPCDAVKKSGLEHVLLDSTTIKNSFRVNLFRKISQNKTKKFPCR